MIRRIFLIPVAIVFLIQSGFSQPEAGDFFREYIWTTPPGNNSPYLRVGGKLDYQIKSKIYPDIHFNGRNIPLNHTIDLRNAIRAEIVIEKVLCHFGTQNLRISLNGNKEIVFPEADSIPSPMNMYMHHFFPVVQVPLHYFHQGEENFFSLQVDENGRWPQNLVYGVVIRVYYEPDERLNNVTMLAQKIDEDQLKLSLKGSLKNINSVDYLAKYFGPDLNGDGIYYDWNHGYHRGELLNHPGSSSSKPFEVTWNTEWVPDQDKEIMLTARVHFKDGMIGMLPIKNYHLKRQNSSVELCIPYNVKQKWITRLGEKEESFIIKGDTEKIQEARLVFTSWSPGYLNGIYINDFIVFTREGPRYSFLQHNIALKDTYFFIQGENILKTGATPKFDGKMVHGTEIMWPGIMILVKYK